tara:strand:- start:2376 stop:2942 length:567 start_codon:yes stop_codon:yes gene_type:complete
MPSEDDGLVSVETIANILKLTPRRVQQLSNQGVIPKAKRGRYKIITSVWGYIDYLKKINHDQDTPDDLKDVNLKIAKHKARLMELEVAERTGDLIKVDEVISTWSKIFNQIKQSALSMPARLIPQLLSADNINIANVIAKEYIENFLNEHADLKFEIDETDSNEVGDPIASSEIIVDPIEASTTPNNL